MENVLALTLCAFIIFAPLGAMYVVIGWILFMLLLLLRGLDVAYVATITVLLLASYIYSKIVIKRR